jgi:DNA-binding transcriptional MerR regulator
MTLKERGGGTMTQALKYYTPKELKLLLDIADSSLRKWCLALEEQGYLFDRTDNNKRIFTDNDLIVLKHFRNLVQVQFMSLQNAAVLIAMKYKEEKGTASEQQHTDNDERSLPDPMEVFGEQIGQLLDHIQKQDEFNKELLGRLDEQQKYIEQTLSETLRTSQETQKLISEVKTAEDQKKPRKGLLRWFNKE